MYFKNGLKGIDRLFCNFPGDILRNLESQRKISNDDQMMTKIKIISLCLIISQSFTIYPNHKKPDFEVWIISVGCF